MQLTPAIATLAALDASSASLPGWLALALLLIAQGALDAATFRIFTLPQRCYHTPWILGAALRRPAPAILAGVLVLLSLMPLALTWLAPAWGAELLHRADWSTLDPTGALRAVFFTVIATITLSTAAQSPNHYYNHTHWPDRLLILAAAFATVLTPLAAPILLLGAMTFVMQLNYPHALYHSWTEKRPLYEVLILLAAATALAPWVRVEGWMLLVGVGVSVATGYIYPAISKLRLGRPWTWALTNRIERLVVSSAHKGWMWWWSLDRVLGVARTIAPVRAPIQVATLLLELGAVFVLVHPTAGAIVLVGLILMHTGIFISSGIAFWKWILLDAALALALLTLPASTTAAAFAPASILIAIAAIVLAHACKRTLPLGWIDSPIVGHFTLEATTTPRHPRDDARRVLSPLTLRPYDVAFGQARFHFLIPEPQVAGSYGILTRPLDVVRVDRLMLESRGDPDAVAAIAREHGVPRHDPAAGAAFVRALRQYFRARNAAIARKSLASRILSHLHVTPPHVWNGARGPWLRADEPVHAVSIRWVEIFHEPASWRVVADREVARFDVEEAPSLGDADAPQGRAAGAQTARPEPEATTAHAA